MYCSCHQLWGNYAKYHVVVVRIPAFYFVAQLEGNFCMVFVSLLEDTPGLYLKKSCGQFCILPSSLSIIVLLFKT